jgi:hypothetical protein
VIRFVASLTFGFPHGWAEALLAGHGSAKPVVTTERLPGSLEPPGKAGLDYRVMDQAISELAFPWTRQVLLHPRVIKLASLVGGTACGPIDSSTRAINVNYLDPGKQYERHIDGNLVTCVCFANDANSGRLEIYPPNEDPIFILPKKAECVMFQGGVLPHRVDTVIEGLRATLVLGFDPVGAKGDGCLESSLYN